MPKKKFIDKKKAITFHLVHRSQQDPLTADETAPQRVLLPVQNTTRQIEEQHKYGIFFDDDYNYLQHLRDTTKTVEWVEVEKQEKKSDNTKQIQLPSSVFASTVEEDVGLLNKAAPEGLRLDLDPDIVAAMDEDFDYDDPDNQLEDNFMEMANAEGDDDECDDEEDYDDEYDSNFSDEEYDEVGSLENFKDEFKDEETKSRFTEYSMSSSVIRRNNALSLLDDRFEKMFAAYDDNEIGALDCEDIEGHVPETSDLLLQCADEFEKERRREQLDKEAMSQYIRIAEDDDDDELVNVEVRPKERWDCESILSTYSNIYNHPKLITEKPSCNKIKINPRTGIPIDVLNSNRLTAEALSKFNQTDLMKGPKSTAAQSIISHLSTLSIRNKGESPEEKRDRKKALKEYRRERRLEKKTNTIAFKEEAKRQVKIDINNRNNIQGNRIL